MATPVSSIESLQQIEIGVSGPGSANRLFIVNGMATVNMNVHPVAAGEDKVLAQSFSALVGPVMTSDQFRRAVAIASPNGPRLNAPAQGPYRIQWYVGSVDAVFNDDSGQTELRFDMTVRALAPPAGSIDLTVFLVAFQVSILAAI
jgi:hypothetical protein